MKRSSKKRLNEHKFDINFSLKIRVLIFHQENNLSFHRDILF